MEVVLGFLWMYGVWKGWQQITSGSDFGAWIPANARSWMNQKNAAAMVVKACVAFLLGGLFAVFALVGLLLKLIEHIARG